MRKKTGKKVGGRQTCDEMNSQMVACAKKLHQYLVNGKRKSLREIANELASAGHVTSTRKPYAATAVAKMVAS